VHGVGEGVGAALSVAVVTRAARGMVGGVEAARVGIPKGLPVRAGEPHRDQTREEPPGQTSGSALWENLQEGVESQWWEMGNSTHIKNPG
jgi:hypothetical protein